jgi:N-carbamoyl-L-amino-acid hydrolase
MDFAWVERLRKCARDLGLPDEPMASGAGHDAATFAGAGIPSAMVFVRNKNGSHNPDEAMTMDDFLAGLSVMRAAIVEAAR